MLEWFLSINSILRELRQKAIDARSHLATDDVSTATIIKGYLKSDYQALWRAWEDAGFDTKELGHLGRHIGFGEKHDYDDILQRDIPAIESWAEKHAREGDYVEINKDFEELLHPRVFECAYQHYKNGHLREAVLNAFVSVYDLIREQTDLDLDGQALVSQAFSLDNPKLIFSELDTNSGKNDQKGFIQILTGAYLGIRNPKAHSLRHDLDELKAAQYLVFASILARRVSEAVSP